MDATAPRFFDKDIDKRVKKTWEGFADFIAEHWEREAEVVVLGDVVPGIAVPLGWAGGLPGVRHVFYDDLRQARELKGVPTAKV